MNKYEVQFNNGAFVVIEIEPDIHEIFTEEYMEDWRRYFYGIYTPEGHLKQIAFCALEWPNSKEWEGYGPVKGFFPQELTIVDGRGNKLGTANVRVIDTGEPNWDGEVRRI